MDECKNEICSPACVKRRHTELAETTGDEQDEEGKKEERNREKKQVERKK